MSRYTQSEKDIMDSWYPPSQAERFQEFAKAGFDWTTGNSLGQKLRADASARRTEAMEGGGEMDGYQTEAMNADLNRADELERSYGDNAIHQGGGNTSLWTSYMHGHGGKLVGVDDAQQNRIAENVSDGDYGAVYDDDGKLIDRLNPKEEHDRLRHANHDMNEEFARAGEAQADPMDEEDISEEVIEEDPEERRNLNKMKARMSRADWDKFVNNLTPEQIESLKASTGIDITKEKYP